MAAQATGPGGVELGEGLGVGVGVGLGVGVGVGSSEVGSSLLGPGVGDVSTELGGTCEMSADSLGVGVGFGGALDDGGRHQPLRRWNIGPTTMNTISAMAT